jgi:hypothetical protein
MRVSSKLPDWNSLRIACGAHCGFLSVGCCVQVTLAGEPVLIPIRWVHWTRSDRGPLPPPPSPRLLLLARMLCMHSPPCLLSVNWLSWSRLAASVLKFSQSIVIACNELSARWWERTAGPCSMFLSTRAAATRVFSSVSARSALAESVPGSS